MKIVSLGAGLVALTAVALGATTWITGRNLESGFHLELQNLARHGIHVEVADYRRGWLTSEARTHWSVVSDDEPLQFEVRHSIEHGPLPAGHFAQIRSALQPTPAMTSTFGNAFADQPPLLVLSSLGWGGSHDHVISSPVVRGEVDDLKLTWGGMVGTLGVNADGSRVKGELMASLIRLTDDAGGEMSIEQLRSTFSSQREGARQLWTGPATVEIDRVHMRDPVERIAFELNSVLLDAESRIDGEVLSLSSVLAANRARFTPHEIEDLELRLRIERLDANALDALSRRSAELALLRIPPEARGEFMHAELETQLPHLLARGPYLEIERLGGRLPDGDFSLNARIGHAPSTRLDLINRLGIVVGAHAPAPFMRDLITEQQRAALALVAEAYGIAPDSPEFESLIVESVAQRVAELEEMNLIVIDEERWSSEARFEGGSLRLNGEPADELLFFLISALLMGN